MSEGVSFHLFLLLGKTFLFNCLKIYLFLQLSVGKICAQIFTQRYLSDNGAISSKQGKVKNWLITPPTNYTFVDDRWQWLQ